MRVLFATTSIPTPANEDALPLFAYVEESVREAHELQIGRASCRERVCQYV